MANIQDILKLMGELTPEQQSELKSLQRQKKNMVLTPELDSALNTLKSEYDKLTDEVKKSVFKKHKLTLGGIGLKIGKTAGGSIPSIIKQIIDGSENLTEKEILGDTRLTSLSDGKSETKKQDMQKKVKDTLNGKRCHKSGKLETKHWWTLKGGKFNSNKK